MSLEQRRYKRQGDARADKQQTILTSDGIKANPNVHAVTATEMVPYNKKVTCPFCLGLEEFRLFLVSTKKGISRGSVHCPLCGRNFHMTTLIQLIKWGPKEYAEWVRVYARMGGFWKVINRDVWKKRLRIMGWTDQFWTAYKEAKEADTSESYTDYLDRKQMEQAVEQGWVDGGEKAGLEAHA